MSYSTYVPAYAVVVNESNVGHSSSKRGTGYAQRDLSAFPYGRCASFPAFDMPLVELADAADAWAECVAKRRTIRQLLSYRGIKAKNQGSTPLCWAFAPTQAVAIARGRQGEPFLDLSPGSVAALANGYKLQGGWGGDALEILIDPGACPSSLWAPQAVARSLDTDKTRAARAPYRALEWRDIVTYGNDKTLSQRQALTCVLNLLPLFIGNNAWGHEYLITGPYFKNDRLVGWEILNSWGESWSDGGYGYVEGATASIDDGQCLWSVSPSAPEKALAV